MTHRICWIIFWMILGSHVFGCSGGGAKENDSGGSQDVISGDGGKDVLHVRDGQDGEVEKDSGPDVVGTDFRSGDIRDMGSEDLPSGQDIQGSDLQGGKDVLPDGDLSEPEDTMTIDTIEHDTGDITVSPPAIDFVVSSAACGEPPMKVEFTVSNTGGPIASMEWDFGDGETLMSTELQVYHTYDKRGLYTVSLTVTGEVGDPVTVTRTQYLRVIREGWSVYSTDMPCEWITDIWQDKNDLDVVFAISRLGIVLRHDAVSGWTTIQDDAMYYLTDIHGSGPDNVWVVGSYNVVRRWNGSQWMDMTKGLPTVSSGAIDWNGVHVVDESNVWIVGYNPVTMRGHICQWTLDNGQMQWVIRENDGSGSPMNLDQMEIRTIAGRGTSHLAISTWPPGSSPILLVSTNGGMNWYQKVGPGNQKYITELVVTATDPFTVFMVGSRVYRFQSVSSTDSFIDITPLGASSFVGIDAGVDGSAVWALSYSGLYHLTGDMEFTLVKADEDLSFPPGVYMGTLGVHSTTEVTNIRVTGWQSFIIRWSFPAETSTVENLSQTCFELHDVWGVPGKTLYMAADKGNVFQWDGNAMEVKSLATADTVQAIWGADEDNLYIVGDNGLIARYNRTMDSWSPLTDFTSETLYDVYGFAPDDIYAVGANNGIFHLTQSWDEETSVVPWPKNFQTHLYSIWGNAADSVWISGAGVILRKHAETWELIYQNSNNTVFGSCTNDINDPVCKNTELELLTSIAGVVDNVSAYDLMAVGLEVAYNWQLAGVSECPSSEKYICRFQINQVTGSRILHLFTSQTELQSYPTPSEVNEMLSIFGVPETGRYYLWENASIGEWDGSQWGVMDSHFIEMFEMMHLGIHKHQIYGFSANDFYVPGYDGHLFHYQSCP